MYKLFFLFPLMFVLLKSYGQDHTWTPEDIVHTVYVQGPMFSPDNSKVVWTQRKAVKEADRFRSEIYLTYLPDTTGGTSETIQLTQGDDSNYSPMFSRDGKKVYFLSSRDEGKKLWSLNLKGGEAKEVHEFDESVSSLQWKDESTMLLISNDGPTKWERDLKKKKDDTQVIEDTVYWRRSQVYEFSLEENELHRITSFDFPVTAMQASRDGKWMIMRLQMSPHYPSDAQPKSQYYLRNLEDGSQTRILEGLQTPGPFTFNSSSSGFYFLTQRSSNPEWNGAGISELHYYDLSSRNTTQVDLQWEYGASSGPLVIGDDVLIRLANGATHQVGFYRKVGDHWVKSEPDFGEMQDHVSIQTVSEDGTGLLFVHSTASQLPTYHHTNVKVSDDGLEFSEFEEWTSLNDGLKKKEKARSEVIIWTGARGDEVDGILYYPIDYEEGKRYPLLLSIHGGPAGTDTDSWSERWSTYPNLWTERGVFVLKPNYHGSSNHGLEFVESIKGHYYDLEMEDILNGISQLDQQGLIDTEQMGAMGWSNGAILVTMLTVRYPEMFKVATPGAGDVNWTSDFGTCRFGVSFDQSYFGGAPWDDVDGNFFNPVYLEKSPLFELEKVVTPTLIFHGSEDRAVPRDQGWEYYRALQQVDKAPVRFLWFPNQPHGLQKISHQLRKMNEEIAWVERWLFGEIEDDNPAVDDDSRLSMLIARSALERNGTQLGASHNGILVPQLMSVGEDTISIGVTEVTNAQFAALVSNHLYPVGADNMPVVNVSSDQIDQYLSRLSDVMGSICRLPSTDEAAALHEVAIKVADDENVLEYWVGYAPTPREIALIEGEIDAAEKLVKECATFKAVAVGDARVYDLGGNVAELAQEGTYGFAANQVPGNSDVEAKLKGFRVVTE